MHKEVKKLYQEYNKTTDEDEVHREEILSKFLKRKEGRMFDRTNTALRIWQ
ncbi:MAG: hypothetical protein IPJ92_08290 [Veillonella sp.]|nr:hypothetical protein [Veillonella sp.]